MSNMVFRGMSLWLKLREERSHRSQVLREAGLEPDNAVLDYGCGIGSYTIPAARIVGDGGIVYALDIHPPAIEAVGKRARRTKAGNVRAIRAHRDTGLPDESVDLILLYDVLHSVEAKRELLRELHRVLEHGGLLSVKPDDMTHGEALATITAERLFVWRSGQGDFLAFGRLRAGTERSHRSVVRS